eukprot:Polyplicarium_translucidae@DN2802_c0_g2_i1.p1
MNLGSFDEKYDAAFSAVLPAEAIVTETTKDAQAVVEFVRKNQLGRVTCIVMQTLEKELRRQLDEVKKAPTATLMIDLIKCDSKYRIAFFYALRDTLVVDNLETARKVAFGGKERRKVATLEGQVVDRSGTITGGKVVSAKFKNAMAPKTTARDIEEMKTSVRDRTAEADGIKERRNELDRDVAALEAAAADAESRAALIDPQIANLGREIESLRQSLGSIEAPTLTEDEKQRVKELEAQLSALSEEKASCERKAASQQAIVETTIETMREIGGEERKALKAEVEETRKRIDTWRTELKEREVAAEVGKEKRQRKTEQAAAKNREMQEEKVKEAELAQKKEELTDEAEKVLDKKEAAAEQHEQCLKAVDVVNKKIKKLLDGHKQLQLQEVEFQNIRSDLEGEHEKQMTAVRRIEKGLLRLQQEETNIPIISRIAGDVDKSGDGSDEEMAEVPNGRSSDAVPEETAIEKAVKDPYTMSPEDMQSVNLILVQAEVKKVQVGLDKSKPDFSILERYSEAAKRLREKTKTFEEVRDTRAACKRERDALKAKRESEFMAGFQIIASRLREIYQMLTLGGDAELELADAASPFSEGVVFSVRPPKKSWKLIQNLSGGEKTLSSLALIFALHMYRPTPIYFLDEIDAALDYRNVSIIANYIALRTTGAQFIVVSLRNQMFEKADRLVGIFKTEDVTKTVAVDPQIYATQEKKERDVVESAA